MKIKTRKNNKKIIIISVALVAIIAIAIGVFVWKNTNENSDSNGKNSTVTERAESDKDQLNDLEENPEKKNQASNTDQPAPIITDEETGKKRVYMVSSHDMSGGYIYIRGGMNSPVSGGKCSAILTGPNGQTTEKQTDILLGAATADCKTVEVPQSELSAGTWKYKLKYTSETIEGETSEGSFEIN